MSEDHASAVRILREVPLQSPKALLRHARRLYSVADVPEHINRHNRKAWARSVALLGDRWLLAVPQGRTES